MFAVNDKEFSAIFPPVTGHVVVVVIKLAYSLVWWRTVTIIWQKTAG